MHPKGDRYLRWEGNGKAFLKAGPGSPENLLAFHEFDGTYDTGKHGATPGEGFLHKYEAHVDGYAGELPHVWVRAYSTNSEDNGIHVGLDCEWPASGQRLQWCEGKNPWRWDSKQRTDKVHCGASAWLIYLNIKAACGSVFDA